GGQDAGRRRKHPQDGGLRGNRVNFGRIDDRLGRVSIGTREERVLLQECRDARVRAGRIDITSDRAPVVLRDGGHERNRLRKISLQLGGRKCGGLYFRLGLRKQLALVADEKEHFVSFVCPPTGAHSLFAA